MKKLIYHFIKNFPNKKYIIIVKRLSYFLIILVWSFIIIGHSQAETKNSNNVLNNNKLNNPIFCFDIEKLMAQKIENIRKLINKEIEKTKKYQKKTWGKEKIELSRFFSRFPDR